MASLIRRDGKSGPVWYVQYWEGPKQKRFRASDVYQDAKQILRNFEDAKAADVESPLPTKTPIAAVLTDYVTHLRATKTPKSCQTDIYYLRDAFGPVCEALKITSRKVSAKGKKRPPLPGEDRRKKPKLIEASFFERITTSKVSGFISSQKTTRGLAPKTANRYREILTRLFNWAMEERGIRMPLDKNPAAKVSRYPENAPEIRFLTLDDVAQQLNSLADDLKMQTMAATLIYAGLRREELLWLTHEDIDLSIGKHGVIRVRAKTIDGEFWQPKTKTNRRVPISSRLRPFLDKWRLKHHEGTWLFPSPEGKRWDPDNFSADLRTRNERNKIGFLTEDRALEMPFTCLHFRHTFGSHLAMMGQSLFKIAKLMGNSEAIVARHYAALMPESLGESVEFDTIADGVQEPALQTA